MASHLRPCVAVLGTQMRGGVCGQFLPRCDHPTGNAARGTGGAPRARLQRRRFSGQPACRFRRRGNLSPGGKNVLVLLLKRPKHTATVLVNPLIDCSDMAGFWRHRTDTIAQSPLGQAPDMSLRFNVHISLYGLYLRFNETVVLTYS